MTSRRDARGATSELIPLSRTALDSGCDPLERSNAFQSFIDVAAMLFGLFFMAVVFACLGISAALLGAVAWVFVGLFV